MHFSFNRSLGNFFKRLRFRSSAPANDGREDRGAATVKPAFSRLIANDLPLEEVMATAVLTPAPIVPAAVYVRLKHEINLAAMTQELCSLRFSIILMARWEASDNLDKENL